MSNFETSSVRELSGADFEDENPEKLKEKQCMFVLFYADWCGHCQNFKPVYAQFADVAQFIDVGAVNVDKNDVFMKRLAESSLKIKGYPTVIKYSNGIPQGEVSARTYAELLQEAMELCNESCDCRGEENY